MAQLIKNFLPSLKCSANEAISFVHLQLEARKLLPLSLCFLSALFMVNSASRLSLLRKLYNWFQLVSFTIVFTFTLRLRRRRKIEEEEEEGEAGKLN